MCVISWAQALWVLLAGQWDSTVGFISSTGQWGQALWVLLAPN